jgi:anti-sigma factor RsiW
MTNKTHYSEADLLETYYTQPGESMPVMMHVADCNECAVRYERIERKVRGLAACDHDGKPETFWARQRISIMRRVGQEQTRTSSFARVTRVAAAAVVALVLGGVIVVNRNETVQPAPPQTVVRTATVAGAAEPALTKSSEDTTDPWQSEELNEFGSMVEWESWVETGDQSL